MAEHDFLTWFAGFFDGEGEYSQIAKTLRRGIKTTRNFVHTLGLLNKRGRVA